MTSEFERIARLRTLLPSTCDAAVVGNGDDAAVLRVDGQLVVTTDALVEDVDFGPGVPWEAVGAKAVHVNASDLAAMGASPLAFVWAVCAPGGFDGWDGLGRGAGQAARELGLPCVGGDLSSTSGPVVVTVTALGTVPNGAAITRAGARRGDVLYLSGALGGAALGLRWLMDHPPTTGRPPSLLALLDKVPQGLQDAVRAQVTPVARLGLGQALRGVATACVDISDGVVQDLCHLLVQSGVGARVDLDALPRDPGLAALAPDQAQHLALAGGEDFELLFTARPGANVEELARLAGVPITAVGTITAPGLELGQTRVAPEDVERLHQSVFPSQPALARLLGWRHF